MERQLDLFSEVDDFMKAEALNTTSVLVKYGYDTSQTYEIIRHNYLEQCKELVVYSNGRDVTIRKYKSITECMNALYEDLKDRTYEYSVEVDEEYVYYLIHKLT